MRTLRRLLLPGVLAAAALAAAGCYPVIQSVDTSQPDVGGPVTVTATICQGNNTDNGGANPWGTVCDPAPGDPTATPNKLITLGFQLLAGYQVPSAATPVDAHTSGAVEQPLHLHQPYTDYLTASFPPPAGRKWVGFASDALPDSTSNVADVAARFTMPEGSAAMPYEIVLRGRDLSSLDADAPVLPGHLYTSTPLAGVVPEGEAPLRDVTLAAASAAPVEAHAGQTASVPFVAEYRGASPSGPLPVTAATALPGATAAPDASPVQFGASGTAPLRALVTVPQGAPLGDHEVALTIPLADGGKRTASATLRVVAPPPAAAAPTKAASGAGAQGGKKAARLKLGQLAFRSTKRAVVLRDGLRFTQDIPAAGKVVWELRRGTTRIARLTRTVTRAGKQTATLKLTKPGKRAARRGRRAPVTLRTTLTPAGAAAVTQVRSLTLGR